MIHEPKRGRTELFNLHEDPGETQNISRLRRSIATELVARMRAYREQASEVETGDAVQPDEETIEKLRSLGYIQ